jgi:hypothetical protein
MSPKEKSALKKWIETKILVRLGFEAILIKSPAGFPPPSLPPAESD